MNCYVVVMDDEDSTNLTPIAVSMTHERAMTRIRSIAGVEVPERSYTHSDGTVVVAKQTAFGLRFFSIDAVPFI